MTETATETTLTPEQYKVRNSAHLFHTIVDGLVFRDENETATLHALIDNIDQDMERLITRDQPIAPSQGQPNAVIQALQDAQKATEEKLNLVLEALSNSSLVTTPPTTDSADDSHLGNPDAVVTNADTPPATPGL